MLLKAALQIETNQKTQKKDAIFKPKIPNPEVLFPLRSILKSFTSLFVLILASLVLAPSDLHLPHIHPSLPFIHHRGLDWIWSLSQHTAGGTGQGTTAEHVGHSLSHRGALIPQTLMESSRLCGGRNHTGLPETRLGRSLNASSSEAKTTHLR